MPKLGLTMTEGGLAQWLVKPGQTFKKGDPLLVVETEKVANEIAADADGIIDEILVPQGQSVAVGTVLARWSFSGQRDMATPRKQKPRIKLRAVVRDIEAPPASVPATGERSGRIVASPYARRLAHAAKLDLVRITTKRIRITAEDVRRALKDL